MMRRTLLSLVAILCAALLSIADADAQVRWAVGGKIGLSIASYGGGGGGGYWDPYLGYWVGGGGGSTSQAGLQIGPFGEVTFSRQFAAGSEFLINTQSGTPIEWSNYFKMYFPIRGSQIRPYANLGFNLFFVSGGPYFGIKGGGGALFNIARNLYIPGDVQLGPVFTTGSTTFYIAITSGIRYEIP